MKLLVEILEDLINDKLKIINKRIDKLSKIMYVTPAGHIDKEVAGRISLEYQRAATIREKLKQVKKLIYDICEI